ncbi:MAG: hypothetical protein LUH16_06920 [Clostridiales bacterium]|nr:hypothetical protein [Clostridiales bacterium]
MSFNTCSTTGWRPSTISMAEESSTTGMTYRFRTATSARAVSTSIWATASAVR